MYSKVTEIFNESGLHARPATLFVKEAKKYQSAIKITNLSAENQKTVNAKSVVSLLSIGGHQGSRVEICAEGEDEQQAVEALVAMINSGLGE